MEIAGAPELNAALADANAVELRAIVNMEMPFGRFKGQRAFPC